jgi:hypothetical protein
MRKSDRKSDGKMMEVLPASQSGEPLPWLPYALLAAVLALHVLINSASIDSRYFWVDESTTYEIAKLPFIEAAQTLSRGDSHKQPPLFYWTAHVAMYFGDSPAYLRGISFAFMAGLFAFIMLGLKELLISSRLVAVFLFTLSPFTLYTSRSFRPYGMATFFIFVSSVLLYRALIRHRSWRAAIMYGLAAFGLQYTLTLNCWVYFCQILITGIVLSIQVKGHGLRTTIDSYRPLLVICLVLSSIYALYLFWITSDPFVAMFDGPFQKSTYWDQLVSNVSNDLFSIITGNDSSSLIGILGLGLFAAGIVLTFKSNIGIWFYLLSLFVGQVAFSTYVTYEKIFWFHWRYVTSAFIAFVLFAALGYELLIARRWPGNKSLVPIVVLILAAFPGAIQFSRSPLDPVEKNNPLQAIVDTTKCPGRQNLVFCSPGRPCAIAAYVFRDSSDIQVFHEIGMQALRESSDDNACVIYMFNRRAKRQPSEVMALDFLERELGSEKLTFVLPDEVSSTRGSFPEIVYVYPAPSRAMFEKPAFPE